VKSYVKAIGHCISDNSKDKTFRLTCSGIDRALCYISRPIHLIRASLEDAMEMNRRRLILQFVIDVNDYPISYIDFHRWTWPFAVDPNSGA